MQDLAEFDKSEFDILVAKCGKTIGLKGEIKLIIYSDFLEVFTKGNVFLCKGAESKLDSAFFLTLQSFNPHKNSATFAEITSIERAKNLTSMLLFSTKSLTQKQCVLSENEHFWFEIIGRSVVENGERIGVVSEIERIGSIDYLIIEVDCAIFAKYPHIKAKRFYLPYISRYVLSAENGVVAVQDALLVLESS